MCSAPDDYHITVPPLYENLDDEKYQPLPPPLSPVRTQLSGEAPGTSSTSLEKEQKIGGLLLSQMEEEPVMQKDVPHAALDVEKLLSENGIPSLWNVLCNTSFKGHGHEVEDLQVLLSEIEQWGQQLYPEESFDTLISQLEDVSDHPAVQTCVQCLHQKTVSTCALPGSGGCEGTSGCTMGNVIKPESTGEDDPPVT
ncbi:TIMELESS-interacting protein-like isoform X1 [Colossoma macropomum]|uniref:TIMELESS-interacting protein-like isoform X1 n=1 Tax=Colossoma macropomum TaxID=42526 RepID=UPI0018651EB1|nr:TIMELESS-interacting protein-like isoform X1 [Colossoma macropomum]